MPSFKDFCLTKHPILGYKVNPATVKAIGTSLLQGMAQLCTTQQATKKWCECRCDSLGFLFTQTLIARTVALAVNHTASIVFPFQSSTAKRKQKRSPRLAADFNVTATNSNLISSRARKEKGYQNRIDLRLCLKRSSATMTYFRTNTNGIQSRIDGTVGAKASIAEDELCFVDSVGHGNGQKDE